MDIQAKNYYAGAWHGAKQYIDIKSPCDQQLLGKVPAMQPEEIDQVMLSARKGFMTWRQFTTEQRAAYLHRAADYLLDDVDKIAPLLSQEIAKGISACRDEVIRTAKLIHYTAEEGLRLNGEFVDGGSFSEQDKTAHAIVTREPLGVVVAVAPFNYPVNLTASKIAPALMAGNSVVVKGPTQGSLSCLAMIHSLLKADFPDGVINTVTGRGRDIGDYLLMHDAVDFINFTGSTEVGQTIENKVGLTPTLMELGGKDAALVLADAQLEECADEIIKGAFSYSGQRCTAIKRVIVVEEVADSLVALLKEKVSQLSVGFPSEDAMITPLISNAAADFVVNLIQDAKEKGATLLLPEKRKNNLLWPQLIDHVNSSMQLYDEEPFGPVLPIIRVSSVEEAIQCCNASQYGLQASIFTQNYSEALSIAKSLEVGTVHVNRRTQRGPDHFPFLGIKGSGIGVQGIRYSIESMSRTHSTVLYF